MGRVGGPELHPGVVAAAGNQLRVDQVEIYGPTNFLKQNERMLFFGYHNNAVV